jgi:hypothetical protein
MPRQELRDHCGFLATRKTSLIASINLSVIREASCVLAFYLEIYFGFRVGR